MEDGVCVRVKEREQKNMSLGLQMDLGLHLPGMTNDPFFVLPSFPFPFTHTFCLPLRFSLLLSFIVDLMIQCTQLESLC